MSKSLVIVESPTKVKTIKKFLGNDFEVAACMGHVRGLPSRPGSVDIQNGFEPHYEILPHSAKNLKEIKNRLSHCDKIYLATDLDREGEAIAWHLVESLGLNDRKKKVEVKRITFHEITSPAIHEAISHPKKISTSLVNAQQARVVLDYLYGFNLSPFLWRKVRSGLSAGRVQSPALRMICERETEILAFREEEYWTITAELSSDKPSAPATTFPATLVSVNGKKLDKMEIKNEAGAQEIVRALDGVPYRVDKISSKERKENPPPPFITSTLQQEASTKLGFSAKKTMTVAQKLYEGVEIAGESEGLITYMRTDSFHIAAEAVDAIRRAITERFGPEFLHKTIRRFKKKSKTAQEAHEAIRPTDITRDPAAVKPFLTPDQHLLYNLIWKRAMAGQMAESIEDRVSVDILGGTTHLFRASGSTIRFPGFRKVLSAPKETRSDPDGSVLPPLTKDQELALLKLIPRQHFTKPPPRYTEASLVKALEEYGIGRPSTYAAIISVLQERDYVRLVDRRFIPQEVGMVVVKLLNNHFQQYVDYQFTARVEEDLDNIAHKGADWKTTVCNFWEPFDHLLKVKTTEVKKSDIVSEPTDEKCPECGKPLLNRLGPYGRFLGCTGYPKCGFMKPLNGENGSPDAPQLETDEVCEKCGSPMAVRNGRFGPFLGCSAYPKCKHTKPFSPPGSPNEPPVEATCEKCGAQLVMRRNRFGKLFLACPHYPKCNYATSLKKRSKTESS